MSFFDPQNPGLGGIDELTDAETLTIQNISALGDPNADRILFWDDSAGSFQYLSLGAGLSIAGTVLSSSGGTGVSNATYVVDAAGGGDFTDLQSAIDALGTGGGKIFVKAGTYTVGAAGIRIGANNITIEGEGPATRFNFNSSTLSTFLATSGGTTQRTVNKFRNFRISQQGTAGTGTAVDFSYFTENIFENIRIDGCNVGFTGTGTGTLYNRFYNCTASVSGASSKGFECGTVANENAFYSCRSLASGATLGAEVTTGFAINAHSNKLIDCVAETHHNIGIDIQASGHDTTIVGAYLELNKTNIQIANGVEGVTFNGGFSGDGTTSNLSDLGAKGLLIDNMRVQYEPYSKQRELNEYVILNNTTLGQYECFNRSTGFQTTNASLDTVWTAVLADISTTPAVITFGAGTFTTTAGLVLANSNIKIRGQGKGVTTISADSGSGVDSTAFFKVDPTQSATSYSLTANATMGDLTVTVSSADLIASGLAAGDYFILYSSLSIDSEFTSRNQGEIHKVISVNTGTGVITIGAANNGTHVYQTMTTANSAKIAKLTMYQNISLQGISFTDTASSRPNTLGTGQVLFSFVDNLSIQDCYFHDMFNACLQIRQCVNTRIDNSHFKNVKDVTPTANVFYGIVVRGACLNTAITNCTFDNMRHGVTQGAGTTTYYAGTTRNYSISNCTSISTFTSHFDVHQGAEGVSFVNNTMVGDDGAANGIQARSPATITGNSIVGVLGKGVSLFGAAHGSVVSGNLIKGCTDGVYVDTGVNKVVITDNTITGGTRGGELSRYTATVTMTIASPCVVTYTAHGLTAGAQVIFTTSGALPTGITAGTVYYVIASGLSTNSFQISATENGSAVNTSGTQSGTHTIAVRSGNDSTISNNNIWGNSSYGFGMNGQTNVKVTGNKFHSNTIPFQIVNTDSTASGWMITDNMSNQHTSTDNPTILGTNHTIYLNKGFSQATEIPYTRDALRLRANGAISETYPAPAASSSSLMLTQVVYFQLIGLKKGDIVTNLHCAVAAAAAGATTNAFAALYDTSGNRLGVTADLTTSLDSVGIKTMALTAPYTVTADGGYYVALLIVNGTPANCPTLSRASSSSNTTAAIGSGVRNSSTQTGQTTMPTTATLGTTSPIAFWMAVS